MPAQKGNLDLARRLGRFDESVRKHADDPTDYGRQEMPGGVSGGVAQLTKCGFGEFKSGANVGQLFFRAEGTALEPHSITDGEGRERPIAGLATSIMIPVCDTKNKEGKVTPADDHIAEILNEFRKLAGDEFTKGARAADLEQLAATLEEAKPYFRFSTSQSAATKEFPNPRVWHNWFGSKGLEDYVPPDNEDAVQDDTEEAPPTPAARNGKAPVKPTPTKKGVPAKPAKADTLSLMDLAMVADDDSAEGQEAAQEELRKMAVDLGYSLEAVNEAADWAEVARMVESGAPDEPAEEEAEEPEEEEGEEETPEEPEEEAWAPQKGEVYLYRVIDPKTGKPARDPKTKKEKKPIEVEVQKVYPKNNTVDLLNMDDKKTTYKGVTWDELVSDE